MDCVFAVGTNWTVNINNYCFEHWWGFDEDQLELNLIFQTNTNYMFQADSIRSDSISSSSSFTSFLPFILYTSIALQISTGCFLCLFHYVRFYAKCFQFSKSNETNIKTIQEISKENKLRPLYFVCVVLFSLERQAYTRTTGDI